MAPRSNNQILAGPFIAHAGAANFGTAPSNNSLAFTGGTTFTTATSGGTGTVSANVGNTTLTAYNSDGSFTFGTTSAKPFNNVNGTSTGGTVTANGMFINSGNTTTIASGSIVGYIVPTSGTAVSTSNVSSLTQVETYVELHQALTELHYLNEDADWKIQTQVYWASLQVAAALVQNDIPKPGVFTHGPKSVVFNWTGNDLDLYLTVSKGRLSVLVSSADGIEYRGELSADNGEATNRFFSALHSTQLLSPPETSDEALTKQS
jgi:hypothetical protein